MSANNRKGITVRFEDAEMEKLEELASRYHVSSATIIRWALKALAEYVEVNNGRITLPLDFSTVYAKASEFSHPTPSLEIVEGNSSDSTPASGVTSGKSRKGARGK